MKIISSLPILASAALLCAAASGAEKTAADADKILREMSAKLASARQFTFKAHREIDASLAQGPGLAEKADINVAVSRPNQIAGRSVSKERTMQFIADGKTLTIFDEKKNHYAQTPMRASIDGLVDRLDKEYGFVPPLADFAVSSPYQEIRQQAHTVTYAGRDKLPGGFLGLGSVECDHLILKGKEADADLWISADDKLPRRLVATFHRAGHPQVKVTFSGWNLAASTPDSTFAFAPPSGAQKVEMWTTARMQAGLKRGRKV